LTVTGSANPSRAILTLSRFVPPWKSSIAADAASRSGGAETTTGDFGRRAHHTASPKAVAPTRPPRAPQIPKTTGFGSACHNDRAGAFTSSTSSPRRQPGTFVQSFIIRGWPGRVHRLPKSGYAEGRPVERRKSISKIKLSAARLPPSRALRTHSNTTVRIPFTKTRSSRCQRTAWARTRRSTSRPIRIMSSTPSLCETWATSWLRIGPASSSAVT
jgi:hypothetical protein